VAPTFAKADKTIKRTLELINENLTSLLAVQQETGAIQSGLYSLWQEVDNLLLAVRGEIWSKSADSMFSTDYYSRFGPGLWGELRKGFDTLSWPGRKFFQRQGWLFILQILLSLAVTLNIRRNRSLFEQDERWRFIARRPLAAGIFFGFFALILFYKTPPPTFRLIMNLILMVALARLLGGFVESVWKKGLSMLWQRF